MSVSNVLGAFQMRKGPIRVFFLTRGEEEDVSHFVFKIFFLKCKRPRVEMRVGEMRIGNGNKTFKLET